MQKIKINKVRLLIGLLVATLISILQLFLIKSNIIIYGIDIKLKYSLTIISLLLLSNFFFTYLILWVLSFNKIATRIVSYIIIVISVIFCFSVYWYSIILNLDMLAELTDMHNVRLVSTFVNAKRITLVVIVLLFCIILYEVLQAVIIRKVKGIQKTNVLGFFIVLIILILSFLITSGFLNSLKKKLRTTVTINYASFPKNIISCINDEIKDIKFCKTPLFKERLQIYLEQANVKNYNLTKKEPQTIVFVFGESLNSSHLKSSGYSRNTTPLLEKQANLIFIPNTVSCATITSIAQPGISKGFSVKDLAYTNNALCNYLIHSRKFKSFIHILNNLGFKSTFISFYYTTKSLVLIKNEAHEIIDIPYLNSNNKEANIKYIENIYKKALANALNSKEDKKLIVIYLDGSHYPYDINFDKASEKFTPIMERAMSLNLETEQDKKNIVNTYDNTIVYTDYLMNYTIEQLKQSKQNSVFYFFSDHGEQLLDKSLYPHGMSYELAKEKYYDVINPGAFVWFSDAWLKNINKDALKNASRYKNATFLYDNIFHSVLDCSGVKSKCVNTKLSICRID